MAEKEKEVAEEAKKLDFSNDRGDPIRDIKRWTADKKDIKKVGEENIYDLIQERAKGMTIGEQLRRLESGDVSVLRTDEPFYGDVSDMPETPDGLTEAFGKVVSDEAARIQEEKAAKLKEAQEAYEKAKKDLDAAQADSKQETKIDSQEVK